MWSHDPPRSLADLALDERRLLEKLDELTPAKYRRQARDDRTGEEVAEAARLAKVEIADDTRIAYNFKRLVEAGFVEQAWASPARYRVTQLGERALLTSRLLYMEKELAMCEERAAAALEAARQAEAELAAERGRTWWQRLVGR
jgi:hypothetical protein